ncbi:MAG: DUF1499 domain-containing protein [Beijerinckiaceae bacterium]|nr:DUF1499 domain-containing protein [Beijerinckiaceae bacterium]
MRRILLEEPLVRSAAWSRTCAVFALTVALLGILMARKGLDPTAAIAIEGGAVVMAGLAILFALAAMVVIWRTGYRGTGRLLAGLLLSALVLAYPAYLAAKTRGVPVVGDVSTDAVDPPAFSHAAPAASGRKGHTPENPSAANLEAQRRLYPDLQPVVLDEDPLEAFKGIVKILSARHWTILEAVPPSVPAVPAAPVGRPGRSSRPGPSRPSPSGPVSGHIDAVAFSLVMGFPADVAIRVQPVGNQTKIDVRSVSRTKWHEPDADMRRVQALAGDIEEEGEK